MFFPSAVHKSREFYENPELFNPHRFDGNESNTLQGRKSMKLSQLNE